MKNFTIRLNEKDIETLKKLADKSGDTLSAFVRKLIKKGINESGT